MKYLIWGISNESKHTKLFSPYFILLSPSPIYIASFLFSYLALLSLFFYHSFIVLSKFFSSSSLLYSSKSNPPSAVKGTSVYTLTSSHTLTMQCKDLRAIKRDNEIHTKSSDCQCHLQPQMGVIKGGRIN